MLWAVCVFLVLALGTGALWWSWRHADDLLAADADPTDAGWAHLCLGPIAAPATAARRSGMPLTAEGEVAGRLLRGGIAAERYRAEMERLAAGDADHPMTVPE